jgi:hypothetical protein
MEKVILKYCTEAHPKNAQENTSNDYQGKI